MKEDIIIKLIMLFLYIIVAVVFLLVVALIVLYVYALTKYGNVPISELPTWVWWLLNGK